MLKLVNNLLLSRSQLTCLLVGASQGKTGLCFAKEENYQPLNKYCAKQIKYDYKNNFYSLNS